MPRLLTRNRHATGNKQLEQEMYGSVWCVRACLSVCVCVSVCISVLLCFCVCLYVSVCLCYKTYEAINLLFKENRNDVKVV